MKNRRPSLRLRPLGAAAVVLLAASLLAGCFNPFSPQLAPERGFSEQPPTPDSPSNVLRLLEWCYQKRSVSEYRELFTADYRFYFSTLDSAGNAYRDAPWTREDELISATNLFQGGTAEQPAATSIVLSLDGNFSIYADPRFPNRGRWYKTCRTRVSLSIRTSDGSATDISGAATFSLVRGDSALIPKELIDRGFQPDSNRWYIRRWDDDTAQPTAGAMCLTPLALPLRAAPVTGAAVPAVADPEASPSRGAARVTRATDYLYASWGFVKVAYR